MDLKNLLSELKATILTDQETLKEISQEIWKHPELNFEERFASGLLADKLRAYGFAVEMPYAGMETAFRAEFARGTGGATFALAAEYDALPGIGHGCGHNLSGVASVAAAFAAKTYMEKHDLAGKIVVLGTPGEEGGGGKVLMLRNSDCLKGVDAVMMAHSSGVTRASGGSTGIHRFDVIFHGKAAHAAGSPHKGLNALDAQILLYNAVGLYRQQMDPLGVIHGVIHEGGDAANIIPDRTRSRYYIRSLDENVLEQVHQRFEKMVEGAALMTGTTCEINEVSVPYKSRRTNRTLSDIYVEAAALLGMDPQPPSKNPRGSSDFNDFTHEAPGAHPTFGVNNMFDEMPGHSERHKACANSDFGREQMLNAGTCLASCAIRVLSDEALRAKIRGEFETR